MQWEPVLLYIVGVIVVVVGVAASIALHELGHFVPAKKFGVRVGQFMIGFGPTLFSRKKGETEYGLKAIPLGGYISMAGMYPPASPGAKARTAGTDLFQTLIQDARSANADTIIAGEEHRSFYRLPIYKRIIIMLGGPLMNGVIAIVLYAIVLCGFGIAQQSTTIGSVSECVLPATSTQTDCRAADAAAPGAEAGIKPGDTLVSIDGTAITAWDQATALIRKSAGEELTIVVDRDGEQLTLDATPALTERYVLDDTGVPVKDANGIERTQDVGFLGIGAAFETVQQPITAVLPTVGDNIVRVGQLILNLPQRMIDVVNAAFGPGERDPNGPISIVGVGRVAGEIATIDSLPVADRVSSILGVLASLNVALMVFNLVPLLPLDGGHIAGALWEGLRRKFAQLRGKRDPGPVDTARLIPLTLTVVVLLGAMSVLLIYADIVKPITIL